MHPIPLNKTRSLSFIPFLSTVTEFYKLSSMQPSSVSQPHIQSFEVIFVLPSHYVILLFLSLPLYLCSFFFTWVFLFLYNQTPIEPTYCCQFLKHHFHLPDPIFRNLGSLPTLTERHSSSFTISPQTTFPSSR